MHSLYTRIRRSKRGSALVTVTIFALIIGFALASLMSFAMARRRETARLLIYNEELNVAEHLLDRAIAVTHFVGQTNPRQFAGDSEGINTLIGELAATMSFDGYNTDLAFNQSQAWGLTQITEDIVEDLGPQVGQWIGYNVGLESYQIAAGASATGDSGLAYSDSFKRPGVYVSRNVSYFAVPLLTYAIFYENLFELDGGARIDVRGRVHTNRDWYLTSSSSVGYHSYCTVAGRFFGGIYNPLDGKRRGWYTNDSRTIEIASSRVGVSDPAGDAASMNELQQDWINTNRDWLSSYIYNPADPNGAPIFDVNEWFIEDYDSDGDGVIDDMNSDGDTTDTIDGPERFWQENPNWVDVARSLFNDFLRDQSHGVDQVRLPIGNEENPYLIIEPPGMRSEIDPRDPERLRPVFDANGQAVFSELAGGDADPDNDSNTIDPRYDKFSTNLAYQASVVLETQPGWDGFADQDAFLAALYDDDSSNDPVRAYRYDVVQAADGTVTVNRTDFGQLWWTETDAAGVVTTHTFMNHVPLYNGREEVSVNLLDLDMQDLADYMTNVTSVDNGGNGFNLRNPNVRLDQQNSGEASPPTVDDGIIYVLNAPDAWNGDDSSTITGVTPLGEQSGVRVSNAADFGPVETASGADYFVGVSIATNSPLYTKGDINSQYNGDTDARIALMLAGDSINILSNAFQDADYATGSGNGPKTVASNTETNAVFVSGNVPTKYGQYGGGGENYYRYLENWGSGKTHLYRGSMLNLWESRIATASWDKDPGAEVGQQSTGYYNPPVRDWGWDAQFATGSAPPGIPTSRQISIGRWGLLSVSEFHGDINGTSVAVNP